MSLFPYLSKKPVPLTVLAGPFRGSRIILNPACSKRKLFGIYEHKPHWLMEPESRSIKTSWVTTKATASR